MKRTSVSFDQSYGVNDVAMAKLKYQTLLKEYLELQKEFVSRKRKLHAAMEKRETILSEVRFLRRRRKHLLKSQALRMRRDPLHLPNSYIQTNALKVERNHSGPEAVPGKSDHFLVSDSHHGDKNGEGEDRVLVLKPENNIVHNKAVGKRKISWPDQVTLDV